MFDVIDIENEDFALSDIGEMWLDFCVTCSEQSAIQFKTAYNLITLSFPDNNLGNDITHILIDDSIETVDKSSHVRKILVFGLIDCLNVLGITIDLDFTEPNHLKDITLILDTLYTTDGFEDILSLNTILENEELDTKGRFIEVIKKLYPDQDCECFDYIIKDVNPMVTKGILVGLNILSTDDNEYLEPSLKKRMVANKPFLKGTLGERHIINGGAPGLNLENLTMLFVNELGQAMVESQDQYLKEVLSLMVVANLSDSQIESQFMSLVNQFGEDFQLLYRAQEMLKQVTLHE
ncbi:putative virion structural protein [Aeromonas phage ZPAH34]|uniref:putative virion structural protein n=1 Tax=Aeromonas phage ZPAH34 TaxID=2924888 RepID=UPI002329969C|nr:putative virion structural protein [Aeromonas phage ZPAH34]UOX39624.1 putative virion structural protein [Aeromonas phage ZPAH34]